MSLIPVILPTSVAAPAFASILTSQDTYLNSLTPLSVVGSGGGGGGSNYPANPAFSTIRLGTEGFIQMPITGTSNAYGITDGYCGIIEGAVKDNALSIVNCIAAVKSDTGVNQFFPFATSELIVGESGTGESATRTGNILWDVPSLQLIMTPTCISSLTVSSINGALPGGGSTVPPNLTLSSLNVSSMITTSSITSAEFKSPDTLTITSLEDMNIQCETNINLSGFAGSATLASANSFVTLQSLTATNVYSSQEINIQSGVSTNITSQVNKINSIQSTIMNSPQMYISSTNVYCDGGVAGGAFVATTPYSIAFPNGTGIFSSLSALPGAVGYAWPVFTLEQYQKISTVCGF